MLRKIKTTIANCQFCQLHKTRIQPVVGSGNPKAKILFIGEAPGKAEDESGEPFVGRSGKILNELLAEIGLKRKDVFITNVVKCRPPKNRDPKKTEIKACMPFLKKQIEIINPKVIVTLGRHAMNHFLTKETISEAHGQIFKINNETKRGKRTRTLIPIYHPAATIYNPQKKPDLIKDFQTIKKMIK